MCLPFLLHLFSPSLSVSLPRSPLPLSLLFLRLSLSLSPLPLSLFSFSVSLPLSPLPLSLSREVSLSRDASTLLHGVQVVYLGTMALGVSSSSDGSNRGCKSSVARDPLQHGFTWGPGSWVSGLLSRLCFIEQDSEPWVLGSGFQHLRPVVHREGFGFRVQGLESRVHGGELMVQSLGSKVLGLWFRFWEPGSRVQAQ